MNARRVRDGGLALVIGFGLTTAAMAANDARGRHRDELLGGVDLFEYCRAKYGENVRASAVNESDDAVGWRCTVRDPIYRPIRIDMDEACSNQYDTDAVARTLDTADQFSWRCYSK